MKKFTFMLLAAFIAVTAMAAGPEKRGMQALKANAVTSVTKQVTPKAKAVKVEAPVKLNKMAQKAKAGARKAAKKVGAEDLLSIDWMLCSDYYQYDSEAGGLVEATPASGGTPVTFKMVDEETIAIEGFTSDATEAIQATFAMTTNEELLAEGIIIEASIADGQTLRESDYGPILLRNFSAEEGTPIKAYIYEDGYVVFDALWADIIGGDGEYAGYAWSGYYYSSNALPVNGTMTVTTTQGETSQVPVVIDQDPEDAKYVTVYNFAGEQTAVTVTMKEDKSFVIDEQPIFYYNSEYGYFYVSGLLISGGSYYLDTLTGVGTENTLTFNGNWMLYSPTKGSIYSLYEPATITLLQGEFAYPVIEDVAAVPADPEILSVGNYDSSNGYGYVSFTVPTTDVDGNDLKETNLFYQFYSDIAGDIQPIVFTPEICEKLTEDMTIIPYTFTDNWDFADKGTYKVVFLNYNFNTMYDRIGVKSIYTGGGETNESEIAWAEVEKPVTLDGDYTFDFNAMDVATSSNITTDGDITETVELTEGSVTLAISPKTESATTQNRFWGTSAGPQLRVYSGTLTFSVPEGYTITQIVFNAARWNDGNVADSGEFEGATWTGSAETVVVTIAGNTQINSIVVTVEAEGGSGTDDGLVVVPEGVALEEYTLEASGKLTVLETRYVAFDGDDVYVQGLAAKYFPEGYVKGKLNADGQVVFKSGQMVGEDEYGPEYLVAFTTDEEGTAVIYEPEFVFNFDAETRTLTMAEGIYVGEFGTADASSSVWGYLATAVYTPGAFVEPPLVEVPDEAVVEDWTLEGVYFDRQDYADQQYATEVAFDGNDIYVLGLAYYFKDAWLKGTIDPETGIATFPAGQYVGKDDYGMEYMNGLNYDEEGNPVICDIQFAYDAEAKTLTQITPNILECSTESGYDEDGEFAFWGYWQYVTLYEGEPVVVDPVTAPEELATETYIFKANELVEVEDDDDDENSVASLRKKSARKAYELQEYSFQTQIGFDGNDVYFKGFSDNTAEYWAKGTLSEDGTTVTIPANQYIGVNDTYADYGYIFYYYLTAVNEDGEMADIVLNYNAETKSFSTDQTIMLNGSKYVSYPYQTFVDVTITKLEEYAATPADPSIESYTFEGTSYPKANFNIPTVDVEGKDLLTSKLFYTVWIEKDNEVQQYTVKTGDYKYVTEDIVEIPYDYDDSWDIYRGGNPFYFNPTDEPATWTRIGVQSIYYGGGERNVSSIVWVETGTGINSLFQDENDAVIYNLAGQRVQKAQKGLFIVNGKKIAVK